MNFSRFPTVRRNREETEIFRLYQGKGLLIHNDGATQGIAIDQKPLKYKSVFHDC